MTLSSHGIEKIDTYVPVAKATEIIFLKLKIFFHGLFEPSPVCGFGRSRSCLFMTDGGCSGKSGRHRRDAGQQYHMEPNFRLDLRTHAFASKFRGFTHADPLDGAVHFDAVSLQSSFQRAL